MYVNVPGIFAGEQLVEHIEALAAGDLTAAELRERPLTELEHRTESDYYTLADDIKALR
ncbi:hypothetical protein [Halomicrococcus gelatinilyticus]|uniref:hypothetical protein n=1 Tax=Halomicrococcus gelatinilyticus TaxID=1702103 RepID=UPI002E12E0C5